MTRAEALARLSKSLDCLERATCYHGLYPHFMHGDTGATKPFSRKDDGADLVETAFLFQGLLCARAYFDRDTPEEKRIRDRITYLWSEAEWDWYTQGSANRAHLALEPDQRLRAEPSRPRLERVPHRLCSGRFCAALCDGR